MKTHYESPATRILEVKLCHGILNDSYGRANQAGNTLDEEEGYTL